MGAIRRGAQGRAANAHEALAQRRRLRGRPRTDTAAGVVDDFAGHRPRGRGQGGDRRAEGRLAGRGRPLQAGRRRRSRTSGSRTSTSTSRAARARARRSAGRRGAPASSSSWCRSTSCRRSSGRSRPTATAGARRRDRRRQPQGARAAGRRLGRRQHAAARGAARRRVGRVRHAKYGETLKATLDAYAGMLGGAGDRSAAAEPVRDRPRRRRARLDRRRGAVRARRHARRTSTARQ